MSTMPLAVLVEDNLMFATAVETGLKALGFEVRTTSGAGELARTIVELVPEVVFVNLSAGRFSASELVRELRSREPAIRIVGYAGHVERERLQAGREAGADLVVPNSAMRKALGRVVEKLRTRSASTSEDWDEE